MFSEQKPKSSALAISKLILAAVVLISISIVLGVAGYMAMNESALDQKPQVVITPEPTAVPTPIVKDEFTDWKTYRNEEYGYEVKYPQNWNEKESSYDDTGILFLNTNKEIIMGGAAPDDFFSADGREINPKYTNDWIGIQIDTYPKPVNFSWDSWIKSNFSVVERYEKFNYKDLIGIKTIELNGIFYGEPNIFIEDNKIYNIRLFNDYPYNTERDIKRDELALNYFNQFLSTFKFMGKDESFSCGTSTVKDVDNNIYKTVQIGDQCWLKENLRVTKNSEGKAITRYCYNNDPNICETDGGLYDWNTAMNNSTAEGAQGICPSGWHVPKDSEWYELENGFAAGECFSDRAYDANGEPWSDEKNESISWGCDPAGKKIKIGGSSGFMSLLSGVGAFTAVYSKDSPDSIKTKLKFRDRGLGVNFWSSTGTYDSAWIRSLDLNHSKVYRGSHYGGSFYSIRCLKD